MYPQQPGGGPLTGLVGYLALVGLLAHVVLGVAVGALLMGW